MVDHLRRLIIYPTKEETEKDLVKANWRQEIAILYFLQDVEHYK
jgi:hypothetical protein